MPRQKTMSPPIQLRLPLENYAVLERMAAARGRTVNEHVRVILMRSTEAMAAEVPGS
jgi:uncharacterized protein (DUF1778 family)